MTYVSTTVSSSWDPSTSSTSSLNEGSTSSPTIDLTSKEPKIKRKRIKHDALFMTEMIQKKEESATTAELINICKSFNLDKTKVSRWMKNKNRIIQAEWTAKEKAIQDSTRDKVPIIVSRSFGKVQKCKIERSSCWFQLAGSKGRKIYREQTGDENAVLKKHVIANFIETNNLK